MKEIIARDLCSYQFEPNSKQSVCDLLGFNIKDFRIETQKNVMLMIRKDGNKCLQLCRLLDRAAENKIKSHL